MKICQFNKTHTCLIDKFDCDNDTLNKFIKCQDSLNPNIGVTYVMLSDEEQFIIGYYNIAVGRVDYVQHINKTTKIYEPMGGAFHINYLCVHKNFQHRIQLKKENKKFYIGDILLMDCEDRILNLNKKVGAAFIILYSTKEGYKLYDINDYIDFEDDMRTVKNQSDIMCYKMYKCIEDIR